VAVTAAPGSWGGQRPSLAPYFRVTEATSRVIARRRALMLTTLFAASVLSFLSDDRQGSVEARHEIRHLMAQAPGDRHSEAAAYFEAQWHALNRSRLWHAGTATILGAVSIWGFRRCGKSVERLLTSRLSGRA
jgi:hypothetical protein